MARRRFGFRKSARRAFSSFRRSRRSSSSNSVNLVKDIALPGAYGAARGWLSNMAQPITSKIPGGNLADNLVFGVAGWYIAKKNLGGFGSTGKAILHIESALAGADLMNGTTQVSTQSAWN